MKYTIRKHFRFEAAHSLPALPMAHKCHWWHGHSYRVTLCLSSDTLDQYGFVKDYGELNEFKDVVMSLDHKTLLSQSQRLDVAPANIVCLPVAHTSAEMLAEWLLGKAVAFYGDKVRWIEVSETETSAARVYAQ